MRQFFANLGGRNLGRTAAVTLSALASAGTAADLWDMREARRHPLDAEAIDAPRKAPLAVPDARDWMNTGDAWVAARKDRAPASAPAPAADGEQLRVEELFFSSRTSPGGPHRIYCAIARPDRATAPVPVVLIFHGGGGHASGALALAAARRHPGMAGVAMDYNGQFAPGPTNRVTRWEGLTRGRAFDLVPDLRNWPMYHSVMAARRTIDFLETQPWADTSRIGAVGISYGGWLSLMLAGVDDRVKCVTTGVSAGGAEFTAGRSAQQLRWEPADQRALWLAHYEPLAHAPNTKAAVFLQLASNDLFFWLNGAAKNLDALPGVKGWVIRPNSNHGAGGPEVPDTAAPAFMRHALAGGPALPRVGDVRVSENGRRYSWTAYGPRPIARAVLNWSPGKAVSPARYWIEFPAILDGNVWSAEIPSEFAGLAAEAFVNVGDEDAVVVSGPLLARAGLDPMTEPGPSWAGHQLWDVDRKESAWRTPAGWLPPTKVEFVPPTGIRIGPEAGGDEFALVSNSAALLSGRAARAGGLRLRVDGNDEAGKLKVTLLRDTNSLDERAYAAEIAYAAGKSGHDILWSAFALETKNAGDAPPMPCPFDGLCISGSRDSGVSVTLEEVVLLP